MKIVLTLMALCIHGVLNQSPTPPTPPAETLTAAPSSLGGSCQQIIDVTILINACQNFVSQRSNNPAIDAMAVDYAQQQQDINKIVLYAEIDIVFISCMQIIGDYEDLQELSGASSSLTNPQSTMGSASNTGQTSTQVGAMSTPSPSMVIAPPPVPSTATAQ